MNFPRNNKELDQIFINGSDPSMEEFENEYWVKMLTGMIPNFRWAGHRKLFFEESGVKKGRNIILLNIPFGYFKVETGQCKELDGLKIVILNYGNSRNLLTRSVLDKIRKIEDGIYLGRYYNVRDEALYFRGYFSLEKR